MLLESRPDISGGRKRKHFNPDDCIDAVLLNNLSAAHGLLTNEGLSSAETQAILIQTMFIAYLEDRGIVTSDFFESIAGSRGRTFADLLAAGDQLLLKRVFAQLEQDFNGDLFVAPCSFENPDHPTNLTPGMLDILRRFRDGREEMSKGSGQLRFWGYDFKYMPVELISAVYDRFLGHDASARRSAGAYYTPMILVDDVVSSMWEALDDSAKKDGIFLDPACGSGIFLVRCFQRLCAHWRRDGGSDAIPWEILIKTLKQIRGRDLNGDAVRVAVFSLYIALLEEVTPPAIHKLTQGGRLLPRLWGETLIQGDFFEDDGDSTKADVVIGNPPWISRQSAGKSGIDWCRAHGFPLPGRENAWAFTWKAFDHVRSGGIVALLLPAMGFLHNHAKNSIAARDKLFKETQVLRVINYADLRQQLFHGAKSPAALIVFKNEGVAEAEYKFDYWTPKADMNLFLKRFVSLSSIDKSKLGLSDVKRNAAIFKQRLWMRDPEIKLFSYLNQLPKLSGFVEQYGSLRKCGGDASVGWVIGQGFQPFHSQEANSSSGRNYRSAILDEVKYLPANELSPLAVNASGLEPWPSSAVRRLGFERGFGGPRILVARGVSAQPAQDFAPLMWKRNSRSKTASKH